MRMANYCRGCEEEMGDVILICAELRKCKKMNVGGKASIIIIIIIIIIK